MAKDPAFLFYSDNFLSGTMFFTDDQVGKYIRLLCAQHLTGHLSEKHMIIICKSRDQDIWDKFTQDAEGKYYNERLENEILRRSNYSKSRSINKLGKNKHKNTSKSYDNHMGNGTETENGIKKEAKSEAKKEKIETLIYPFDSDKFLEAWTTWKSYKKTEHRFSYKSKTSEQAALIELDKLSGHNLEKCIEIIRQSIANGWKGFFPLKENNKINSVENMNSYKNDVNQRIYEQH